MKRRIFWFFLIFILLCGALSRDAIRPDRFTGTWYAAGNGEAYHFREGIIRRAPDSFDGAYAFTRDTVTLFTADPEGESVVRNLRWISQQDGDLLCTDQKEICFCRSREKALLLK